jgi:hypothetical protein
LKPLALGFNGARQPDRAGAHHECVVHLTSHAEDAEASLREILRVLDMRTANKF